MVNAESLQVILAGDANVSYLYFNNKNNTILRQGNSSDCEVQYESTLDSVAISLIKNTSGVTKTYYYMFQAETDGAGSYIEMMAYSHSSPIVASKKRRDDFINIRLVDDDGDDGYSSADKFRFSGKVTVKNNEYFHLEVRANGSSITFGNTNSNRYDEYTQLHIYEL